MRYILTNEWTIFPKFNRGIYIVFLLKPTLTVLFGLKSTNHSLLHLSTRSRSLVSDCATFVVPFSTIAYKEVSSAKSLILLTESSQISFMYKRNKNGPRTEPWGTPALTLFNGLMKSHQLQPFVVHHTNNSQSNFKCYTYAISFNVLIKDLYAILCRMPLKYHRKWTWHLYLYQDWKL